MSLQKRRDWLVIYADLLEASDREFGISPTHLMYAGNMSWIAMVETTHFLQAKGLLEKVDAQSPDFRGRKSRYYYRITEKGRRYVNLIREAESILGPL
jgi:predicted transcriptional regulator